MKVEDLEPLQIVDLLSSHSAHERTLSLELVTRFPLYNARSCLVVPMYHKLDGDGNQLFQYVRHYKDLIDHFKGNDPADALKMALQNVQYSPVWEKSFYARYENIVFINQFCSPDFIHYLLQRIINKCIPLIICPKSDTYANIGKSIGTMARLSNPMGKAIVVESTRVPRGSMFDTTMNYLRDFFTGKEPVWIKT